MKRAAITLAAMLAAGSAQAEGTSLDFVNAWWYDCAHSLKCSAWIQGEKITPVLVTPPDLRSDWRLNMNGLIKNSDMKTLF